MTPIKRTKISKWSQKEKEFFLGLVKARKSSIVGKQGDRKQLEIKNQAWIEIFTEMKKAFGSKFSESDMRKLKSKWQKMKQNAQLEFEQRKTLSKYCLSNESQIVGEILNLDQKETRDGIIDDAISGGSNSQRDVLIPIPIKVESTEMNNIIEDTFNKINLQSLEDCENLDSVDLLNGNEEQELSYNSKLDQNLIADNLDETVKEKLQEKNYITNETGGIFTQNHASAQVVDELQMDILTMKRSAMKAIWEAAEINKIISVQKLKGLLIQKQRETIGNFSQMADFGSSYNKENGENNFSKMETEREEDLLYKQQQKKLKDMLMVEITFHEEQIKHHQEAIIPLKQKADQVEKN